MKHILIVDDNKTSLSSAKSALDGIYRVTAVTSGAQALRFLEKNTCDMILLDINMPEMDGFEVLEKLKERKEKLNVSVIFLTADNDPETESRCLEAGAVDFIVKPFVHNVMLSRISRVLELDDLRRNLEVKLEERTRHIVSIRESMIMGMAIMVESRDNSTGGHIKRTSDVVKVFAEGLLHSDYPITEEFLKNVIRAAPMHDLGKIAVDDVILRKQGKFTDDEYAQMKHHSAEGARIVKQILEGIEEREFVDIAVNIAHYHHEKWNGMGYPEGLAGEEIPVEARIMALADVFDALVSRRCYKDAFSYEKAFSIIENDLGSHFDPVLGKIFVTSRGELEKLYNGYAGDG